MTDAISQALQDQLVARIKQRGWIGFDEYMQQCLYAPGLGYYVAGLHKLGSQGDFITAPEMGNHFAKCLAAQCADWLPSNRADESSQTPAGTEEPAALDIIEFGPGSGQLAGDILLALKQCDRLPRRYLLVEVSPDLRAKQQRHLSEQCPWFMQHIVWLDALPEQINGLVIANEVLDAIPCKRFYINQQGVACELGVSLSAANKNHDALADEQQHTSLFTWHYSEQPLPQATQDTLHSLQLPVGYCSEINLQASAWINEIASRLQHGALLTIDYGFPQHEYYHVDRNAGTLMCHQRHHSNPDPFWQPGLQDITSHVDFTAMAISAQDAGLDVIGYTSQGAFLMGCGILQEQAHDDQQRQLQRSQQIKKLIMPHEMGELFKVLVCSRGLAKTTWRGFSLQNQLARLG